MPYSKPVVFRPRRRRWRRNLSAAWHDTAALWNEFKTPILIFFFVTLVGGYVYGELHALSGREEIALIDRPYIMVQLMTIEPPYDAPSEWYLILFWYALPPIFVFIIANGVAEFVRLFFNRDARRDAWREAVISTYRNHIIVLGAGHVGLRVIHILAEMDIDVVAIDSSPDLGVEEALMNLRVPLLLGDARNASTLEKAGLAYAEAFVACTGDDRINLDAIMRARHMNRDIRIVARVWEDQFATQVKEFFKVDSVLSSSGLAAPAFAGLALGVEITQSLNINGIDFSTMRLNVAPNSFLAGQTVGHLQESLSMDIVLHGRNGHMDVQPHRDILVEVDDILVIFARHDRTLDIAARNRAIKT